MIDRTVFPVRRRKEARPRELLVSALELFIERGFAATKADEIAARAGVSKGTLYTYFSSKEDLLTDLIDQGFFCQFTPIAYDGGEGHSYRELLRRAALTWSSALSEGHAGGVVKLVFTESHAFPALAHFWVNQVMTPTRSVVSSIVESGIQSGEFRSVDSDLAVNALLLPVVATCLHRHAIDRHAPCDFLSGEHEALSRHVDLVLQGLVDL